MVDSWLFHIVLETHPYDSCTSLTWVLYFISVIFLDWYLEFEPALHLKGWNVRALQNETHMRTSILNTASSEHPLQWSGRVLGMISGWDPSVCKSNRWHVDILRDFLYYSIGVLYSINSSKMIGNFPAVSNFNWLFLKLYRFICNQLPVLPDRRFPYLWGRKDRMPEIPWNKRLQTEPIHHGLNDQVLQTKSRPWEQWSGRFLGMTGWDTSVFKSNRLHVCRHPPVFFH